MNLKNSENLWVLGLFLGIIGLVSALILAVVSNLVAGPIEQAELRNTNQALRQILPEEKLIYFGDTARVPYGGRSKETLLKYARQDVHFLRSFDIKALLVACGTVSSNVLPELQREIPCRRKTTCRSSAWWSLPAGGRCW